MKEFSNSKMDSFKTSVINVDSRVDRRLAISSRLAKAGIDFDVIVAVEPKDLAESECIFLNEVTTSVAKSHLRALKHASIASTHTLILEDDAVLKVNIDEIGELIFQMHLHNIDFLQVGFTELNYVESFAIRLRNFYDFVIRKSIFPKFFSFFGFKEVSRALTQTWRKELPSRIIINDVRYGALCYIVSPNFAARVMDLNNPAFLTADDFYISLSKTKSMRMARLKKSQCSQDNSPSSFSKRYILE